MFKILYLYSAAILCVASPAYAQEFMPRNPVYTFDMSIGTIDEITEGPTGVFAAEQVTTLTAKAKARYEWRDAAGNQIFLEPSLRFNRYPSAGVNNSLLIGVFGEYRHRFAFNDQLQLRLRGGFERSRNVFDRFTAQAMLNVQRSKCNSHQFSLRYRYRDQNEAHTFAGYDQHELKASVRSTWKPAEGKITRVVATFYGDFRDAEANRFDYNEIGARLQVRYEPRDKWRITGRLKAYARDYKGSFSTDFDFARSDRRLAVEVDVRYQIDDNAHVFGAFGWEANRSNIAIRDFSGPTFRLGVSVTFP